MKPFSIFFFIKSNIIHPMYCIYVLLFAIIMGCKNDDFSPIGEYQKRLVIYCVLDNASTTYFVKTQQSYRPDEKLISDSTKKLMGKTRVTISHYPDTTYTLKDTIIEGTNNYNVFYFKANGLKRDYYSLYIENEFFPYYATNIRIPNQQKVNIRNLFSSYAIIFPNFSSYGLVFHLYIEYEFNVNGNSVIDRIEVPTGYRIVNNNYIPIYPKIDKSYTTSDYMIYDSGMGGYVVYYNKGIIENTLNKIRYDPNLSNLKIKRTYLLIYSIESNLYTYMDALKGFNDPYSVRLDDIFWTNIGRTNTNTFTGAGVFCAYAVDTVYLNIPTE